jgi:hypothetical protein
MPLTKATVSAIALGITALGCAKADQQAAVQPRTAPPTSKATPTPVPEATPAPGGTRLSATKEAEEACVDKWLAERNLDRYGNPQGTMYAGGTPLFDERTGETIDRLTYVYKRQPLAREACRPTFGR